MNETHLKDLFIKIMNKEIFKTADDVLDVLNSFNIHYQWDETHEIYDAYKKHPEWKNLLSKEQIELIESKEWDVLYLAGFEFFDEGEKDGMLYQVIHYKPLDMYFKIAIEYNSYDSVKWRYATWKQVKLIKVIDYEYI